MLSFVVIRLKRVLVWAHFRMRVVVFEFGALRAVADGSIVGRLLKNGCTGNVREVCIGRLVFVNPRKPAHNVSQPHVSMASHNRACRGTAPHTMTPGSPRGCQRVLGVHAHA